MQYKFDDKDKALHAWLDQPEPAAPKTGADLGLPADNPLAGAPVVSTYSAEEAVQDGFLIDVTGHAKRRGMQLRQALVSRGIWNELIVPRSPVTGQDAHCEDVINPEKPLGHLFIVFAGHCLKGPKDENCWFFEFEKRQVKAVFHGGCLTFCFIEED